MKKILSVLKNHFIPHPGNDHRPHFLRLKSMTVVLSVVIVAEMAFLLQTLVIFQKTNMLAAVLPGVLTALTNENRTADNLSPLAENKLLDEAARLKAEDMAESGYFAHTSPSGLTPWYWFQKVGYQYSLAGENLAVNFSDSADVVKAWMNSPTHRANILRGGFTQMGIGVAKGIYEGRDTVFVAQLFGAPAKAGTEAPPAPSLVGTEVASNIAPEKPAISGSNEKEGGGLALAPENTKVLGEETAAAGQTNIAPRESSVKLFLEKVLTSPGDYLTYVYIAIGILVLIAVLLVVFIKREIRHPAVIFRGLCMLAVIALLAYLNFKALHINTEVPENAANSSTLQMNP